MTFPFRYLRLIDLFLSRHSSCVRYIFLCSVEWIRAQSNKHGNFCEARLRYRKQERRLISKSASHIELANALADQVWQVPADERETPSQFVDIFDLIAFRNRFI
ncbi:Uncharacterized protein HZ326_30828 [Fusarium oxysporum f. sp. albedinis]|nr:Uncharacterized protein HZ326_30828 [Fusarium oxysporum f. sp. albedinis]